MKNLILVLVGAVLLSVTSGCSGDKSVNPWRDCECDVGDTCTVDLGAIFTISLEAAFTAGYKWEFEKDFDERYVELESYTTRSTDPDSGKCGVPMLQVWTYRTREQGTVCGTLIYKAVWDEIPISTENIVVVIK